MPKKPTNNPVISIAETDSRSEFVRSTAVSLLLTLAATNGKINADQPNMVVDIATELANKLKL